ncbi:MAG: ornithine carbamoyltransferase [Nitrospirae bacterium]|nr:MAG: ornithine carbamoyltransferase [Nitrospirota bacterium]
MGNGIPKQGDSSSSYTASTSKKDLLSLADCSPRELVHLLRLASRLKTQARAGRRLRPLVGKTIGLIFEKPSTRTRVSFEAGMNQLGGQALFLPSEKIQLSRGESLADTAQVLSRYLDALVIRTYEQQIVEEWARNATIPVINGLTDLCHPCQALADLLTIMEKKGRLKGVKLAYVGDGNNMANSLIEAGAKVGMHVVIACPSGYEPNAEFLERSRKDAARTGATIQITDDPFVAAKEADVVYTDVWISMGQEKERARRLNALAPYQVNRHLLEHASPAAIVMHCLPAHRGEEITGEVLDGPQSVVLDQAENRLHMQKAILVHFLCPSKRSSFKMK